LKLKAKLRHLRRNPGNVDRQIIESDREELTALVIQLRQAQQTAGVAEPNSSINQFSNSDDSWDDLAFDPVQTDANPIPGNPGTTYINTSAQSDQSITRNTIGPVPIEDQIIALPSNGNTSNTYRQLELSHRISRAEEELNNIRNLIAEKSFQYSHVIRVSPRKSVTTRAWAAVKKLNNQIAEHCRMYAQCRACILILGAEPSIVSRFKVLIPADVAGSTVVLNPNEPGSTGIKLSWIWQTSAHNILCLGGLNAEGSISTEQYAEDPASLLECMVLSYSII
jgi:hypothetical protein